MKLYAKRGFEWAADGCVGLWCPVLTGNTGLKICDSNFTTNNDGNAIGYTNSSQPWVGSEFGTVLSCDGANDRISNNASSLYTFGTREFSFGGWFRLGATTGAYAPLTTNWGNASNQFSGRWFLGLFDTWMRVFDSVGNIAISYTPTVGVWNHYVVSKRQGVVTLYVDSIAQGTYSGTNQNWSNEGAVSIGGTSDGFANCRCAEGFVSIVGYSAHDVAKLYSIGPAGAWQREPIRPRSYFAELLTIPNRRRSSRFLAFPG